MTLLAAEGEMMAMNVEANSLLPNYQPLSLQGETSNVGI